MLAAVLYTVEQISEVAGGIGRRNVRHDTGGRPGRWHAGQVTLPAMVPAVARFFAAQAAIAGNAASTLAQALTFLPLTAPFMLPVRVVRDAIAPWEVVLALCLLAGGAWLLIRIAGRAAHGSPRRVVPAAAPGLGCAADQA